MLHSRKKNWSTPLKDILEFPAYSFIRFFHNHGLLTIHDHPQWYTLNRKRLSYLSKQIRPTQGAVLPLSERVTDDDPF